MAMEKIQPSSVSFQSSGRGLGDADQLGHRQIEDAEGVDLADAEMDAKRGRRDHPAAESGFCDRMATIEYRQKAHWTRSSLVFSGELPMHGDIAMPVGRFRAK